MKNVESLDRQRELTEGRPSAPPLPVLPKAPARWGGRMLGLGTFLLLATGLTVGAWGSYSREREVAATAQQHRDFVPSVRVATVN